MAQADHEEIDVIDISKGPSDMETAKRIREACEKVGCFYISNHGVDPLLIEQTIKDVNTFFSCPIEEKEKIVTPPGKDRGYIRFASESVEKFDGIKDGRNDPLEKYGLGSYLENNIWPVTPPTFQETFTTYIKTLEKLSNVILELFARALDLDPDNFLALRTRAESLVKINYYPVLSNKEWGQIRLAKHTDFVPLTILTTDDVRNSLMIRTRSGSWMYANPIPGTLFINIGDTMAQWTNDKWVATPHQVVWQESKDKKSRVSIAFFCTLNLDTLITCIPSCLAPNEEPKYKPVVYGEKLQTKMYTMAHIV